MRKQITILSIAILLLAGCTTPRQMTLFAGADQSAKKQEPLEYIIEVGDVLQINFTAINSEAVGAFNSSGLYYEVQNDSTIRIPILGKVNLVGKTAEEATQLLTDMVSRQVQRPVVRLEITSAVVTILGEVRSPSRIGVVHPITLLEAIGAAGGFTDNAKCKNVLVQRRENGKLNQYRINLLTDELFTSPCYYLQKGDVVYVAPLHAQ